MPKVVFDFGDDSKEYDLHDPKLDSVESIKEIINQNTYMINKKGEEE
tara:strand:+ start:369 stop:509 length:141 start_codon:yes stop_codon:yes gene_type:complete